MIYRTERLASLIRTTLADAIQHRLSDPRIATLTSITRVEVSADLALARVFVSVLAPEPRQKLCLEALKHAVGRLRGLLAQQVVMRQVPQLDFVLDASVQGAFRTVQAIDEAMAELGEPPPWDRDNQEPATPPTDDAAADEQEDH